MAKDSDVIQEAYEEALKAEYAIFMNNLIRDRAGLLGPNELPAFDKFVTAVRFNKDARDAALLAIDEKQK